MAEVNLDAVVRELVSSAVEQALEPYQDVLSRMAKFMEMEPPKLGVTQARQAPARRRGRRPRAAGGGVDVAGFEIGQAVRYRQGVGTFDALVTKINVSSGKLTLERKADGKVVVRPASKVLQA